MTDDELNEILNRKNAAIIAPAGHGKTEMITELVDKARGKQLVLTHTNAGVKALQERLRRRHVPSDKFHVSTIASYCQSWCHCYRQNSNFHLEMPRNRADTCLYYQELYEGMANLLSLEWVGQILKATYTGIIVDEYQDCTVDQHRIFLEANNFLPVRVFGDPLQGIFSFAGKLVNWNEIGFEIINIETYPWRWLNSNRQLGEYLETVRNQLVATLLGRECVLNLEASAYVKLVPPTSFNIFKLLPVLGSFNSVLYLTKWPNRQLEFSQKISAGIFQFDEVEDCEDLFEYAEKFDKAIDELIFIQLIEFMSRCSTKIKSELKSYCNNLKKGKFDFSKIKKHKDFAEVIHKARKQTKFLCILSVLFWCKKNWKTGKIYRIELLSEMIRSVQYAESNNCTILEGAYAIRRMPHLQRRYDKFKFLSSRTLLSKGLEFDCVIIDLCDTQWTATDFYVAMTRAKKCIYIVTESSKLFLK